MCFYSAHALENHQAQAGEVLTVKRHAGGGTAMYGDKSEVACLASGTRLELVRMQPSKIKALRNLTPTEIVTFYQNADPYVSRDEIVLPSGKRLPLQNFDGFQFQIAEPVAPSRQKTIEAPAVESVPALVA